MKLSHAYAIMAFFLLHMNVRNALLWRMLVGHGCAETRQTSASTSSSQHLTFVFSITRVLFPHPAHRSKCQKSRSQTRCNAR
eukprot:15365788-Ditylum_brightwellii.AAC.2